MFPLHHLFNKISTFCFNNHQYHTTYFNMEERSQTKAKKLSSNTNINSQEVSSIEWEFIEMSEQEEDLIRRMYGLVGDRWNLIAGRIPGRKAEEIERFWIMRHADAFSAKRSERKSN